MPSSSVRELALDEGQMTGWHHESPTNHGVYIFYLRYSRILNKAVLKQKKIATMHLLPPLLFLLLLPLLTLSTAKSTRLTLVGTPTDVKLVTEYLNDVWNARVDNVRRTIEGIEVPANDSNDPQSTTNVSDDPRI